MRYILSAAFAALIMSSPALAQTDERDEAIAAMEACRAIQVDQVRLACMDAAGEFLDRLETKADLASQTAPAIANSDADLVAREKADLIAQREALARERAAFERLTAEREATAQAERLADERETSEMQRLIAEREALENERTALEAARAAPNEVSQKSRSTLLSAPRGLGLFKRDERPKLYETQVTRIIVNNAGRHFFETEDGTTWRQVPPTPLTAPSALPAGVTIRRTSSGARRLKFNEHPNRSYVVVEISEDQDQ